MDLEPKNHEFIYYIDNVLIELIAKLEAINHKVVLKFEGSTVFEWSQTKKAEQFCKLCEYTPNVQSDKVNTEMRRLYGTLNVQPKWIKKFKTVMKKWTKEVDTNFDTKHFDELYVDYRSCWIKKVEHRGEVAPDKFDMLESTITSLEEELRSRDQELNEHQLEHVYDLIFVGNIKKATTLLADVLPRLAYTSKDKFVNLAIALYLTIGDVYNAGMLISRHPANEMNAERAWLEFSIILASGYKEEALKYLVKLSDLTINPYDRIEVLIGGLLKFPLSVIERIKTENANAIQAILIELKNNPIARGNLNPLMGLLLLKCRDFKTLEEYMKHESWKLSADTKYIEAIYHVEKDLKGLAKNAIDAALKIAEDHPPRSYICLQTTAADIYGSLGYIDEAAEFRLSALESALEIEWTCTDNTILILGSIILAYCCSKGDAKLAVRVIERLCSIPNAHTRSQGFRDFITLLKAYKETWIERGFDTFTGDIYFIESMNETNSQAKFGFQFDQMHIERNIFSHEEFREP